MTAPSAAARSRPWIPLFIAVCLVAANMRMTIMGVGPLLDQIADDQGVSPSALGALASVPLLVWAFVSPLTHAISVRIGMSRTISWSLVVLAIGTVWRSLPGGPLNLWLGTALIGAALAVGNVLMPAVIKRDFSHRVPLVMGVYTAVLGALGSVGAGIVAPLSHIEHGGEELGWRFAMLGTGVLILPALVAWVWANAGRRTVAPMHPEQLGGGAGGVGAAALEALAPEASGGSRAADSPGRPDARAPGARGRSAGRRIWRDRLAWLVAFYMGAQSALFYMLTTWLAPLEISRGRSEVEAGFDVMFLQLTGIAGSILIPLLYRGRLRRWLPALIPIAMGVSATGIVFLPELLLLWILVYGLATGASLSMGLTLVAVRARTPESSSALSGMSQSVGYLLAAGGPIAFGWLHEISAGWTLPFALLFAVALGQVLAGLAVGRDRYVLEH
ncbi:MFS transporter [Leucobacter sp. CSA1]|uniref:MFS transporter n=1 Tax=Leucobacter chromiisoli TaxID=2796471 RepID=A0A934UTW2_9MICO|nr:MFS transporter [Leucobacter chromiisoli]MBK0418849.1 MFS transporter [Leucobacter chromiisoli]